MSDYSEAARALFESDQTSRKIGDHQRTAATRGRYLTLSAAVAIVTGMAYGAMGFIAPQWSWAPAVTAVVVVAGLFVVGRALQVPLPPARRSSTPTAIGTALIGVATIALCFAPHGTILGVVVAVLVMAGAGAVAVVPAFVSVGGIRTS